VPLDKIRAAHDRFARAGVLVAITLGLAMTAGGAYAAGLGRLNVQSALGQPLRAEVEVPSVGQDEAATLQVRLAPQSAFRQANLEFNPALTQLRFDLESRGDGTYVVHVSSAQPVNEPFLDLLLELTWSTGRVLREYTVLLDPPALKTAPEVVPPVAVQAQPATPPAAAAPAEAAPAPAAAPIVTAPAPMAPPPPPAAAAAPTPAPAAPAPMAPAPKAAPSQARAKPTPPEAPISTSYKVRAGDTLGRIAVENKSSSVSLDQMLVAMLRANPNAFINNNINLVLAGKTLTLPADSDARAIDPNDAHREVIAQSADFNAYRSRIAQAAAAAPPPAPTPSKGAVQGKVVAKVEEKGAPPKTGDQLKIAKAEAAASVAAQTADEGQMRQRMLKEEASRAEALKKTNEKLAKELEVVSRAAALAQQQARAKADAEQLKAEAAAAKAKAEADAAKARADAAAAKAQAQADAAAAKLKAEADAAKARVDAVAAAKARADAEMAARAKAAADQAARKNAPVAEPAPVAPIAPIAPPTVAKAEPVKPAPPAAPAGGESMFDQLTSAPVLGGLGVVLLATLFGINFYRKKKLERSDEFKSTVDGMRANSLFGATGGQSVDTSATSTFNSSFIPAASQLDSNEVDPVAEADVYIAYGREEQAEEILKEALRLQPDRVGVRVKLLEIYSRRGDKSAFTGLAQDLHDRSGGAGEEWERAAKLGRSLDPGNTLFSGGGAAETAHGPITELRLGASATDSQGSSARSMATQPDLEGMGSSTQPLTVEARSTLQPGMTSVLGMSPGTRQGSESRMGDTKLPLDSQVGPSTRGPAMMPPEPAKASRQASSLPGEGAGKVSGIDFGALDFDLGPTKTGSDDATVLLRVPEERQPPVQKAVPSNEAPTVPSIDLMFEPTTPSSRRGGMPTATGSVPMPEIDLNLPTAGPPSRPTSGAPSSLEEALSRPTLLGAVGALPDEQASRLNSNTDQATVPLIDFDLSGTESTLTGRRTETQAGTPLASQMATKLDLARGYIDLGVKDGARELLEEVMRDGTREQRQQAVELIKMVEA